MQLVYLTDVISDVIVDLRYATPDNVSGEVLYDPGTLPRLDAEAAKQLALAAEAAKTAGLKLVIWDAYRPEAVQKKLRGSNSDERYVLKESNHCKGLAVDITLATDNGAYLDMGTDFDDFTDRAHADSFQNLTAIQAANRAQLRLIMEEAGFTVWPYEWWHFDYLS